MDHIKKLRLILFSSKKRALIFLGLFCVFGFFLWKNVFSPGQKISYQTEKVERGTLVVSLSESGTVALSNRMPVVTLASGVVKEILVKNGDYVEKGQKIAEITLDSSGEQKQASSYASYLSAQSALNKAQADIFSNQSSMYSAWDKYINIAQNSTYQNPDGSPNTSNRALPEFTTAQDNWYAAEANYKNSQTVISQAQASLESASLSSQQSSSEVIAPYSGVVSDITLVPGMQISQSSSTSTTSNTNSGVNIASIRIEGNPVITVSLSEADALKVESNQKVTVTIDALQDKTFTGKVLGVNTSGSVSSGVTTYPATIVLDSSEDKILPNMSATANIITNVRPDVLLVPNAALTTSNNGASVKVMKQGKVITVPVETGLSSDSQTEIISGLSEGDEVVTATLGGRTTTSSSASPFGAVRGFGGGGGGNFIRVGTGGGR